MSIKEKLQKLNENDLRKKIVIPYLKVYHSTVEDWHGAEEKGKDIVYIIKEEEWKTDVVAAVVIKNDGDIKMSGGKNTNLQILNYQLENTYTEPIPFPLDPRQMRYIEKIIVLTSYDINRRAREFISKSIHPYFRIVNFVPGNKLEEMIQGFIKDKNYESNKSYEFSCDTFESFCTPLSYSLRIEEKMKIISINREASRVDDNTQFEN